MSTAYETDVVAWASEQAALLRSRKFSALDIEHIADEVEDVGKSEKRELANRMVVLLAHLLKWRVQPERRGNSWRGTIKVQREDIAELTDDAPSLKATLQDPVWLRRIWGKAVGQTMVETGLAEEDLPVACPWKPEQILDPNFLSD